MPNGAFARWGYYVAAHSKLVLRVSLLVVVIGLALTPVFRVNLLGLGYDTPGSESDRAQKFVEQRSGIAERASLVVSTEDPAAGRRGLALATEELRGEDIVKGVLPGPVSDDGRVLTAEVLLRGSVSDRQRDVDDIQKALEGAMPPGVEAAMTGNSPLLADLIRVEMEDLLKAELVGMAIALFVLLFALRGAIAAGLPLALGISGLVVTFGVLAITMLFADYNLFVETLAAMIGLGVGIDYSMLIVRRFREQRAAGQEPADALASTLATAGRTVTFSGAIVAVSFIPLALTFLPFFAESAVATILVVAVMVLGALTLLPAALIRLGDRLDRYQLPIGRDRRQPGIGWERWARWVMRRPWPVLVVGVALLLACAIPTLNLKTGTDLNARAMSGEPAAEALKTLEGAFPAASLAPVEVLVRSGDQPVGPAAQAAVSLMDADRRLGPPSTVPLGRDAALVVATPTVAADSIAADRLVRDLRKRLPAVLPGGAEPLVSGATAQTVDYTDETNAKTPAAIGLALVLAFVLLTWVFRSPVLALKAIVLNLLSIGAAFGLTVLVFQEGLGEEVLGFTSLGYIQGWMPLTLFVLLFGLSMDYEVFMVTRMREEWQRTGTTEDAVAHGLGKTGGVVTAAAAIMIAIFSSFVLTRIPEVKQMGFGLAVAVLIDATIVRAALVPAFMKVAGRWNWWMPRRLDRLLPEFEH
ncbi:MAG TPA: MMPL family transporter [Solirubrobacteraceae bacterium]